jgi:hypothetical protein
MSANLKDIESRLVSNPPVDLNAPDGVWRMINTYASETTLRGFHRVPREHIDTYPVQYLLGRSDMISNLFAQAVDIQDFMHHLPGTVVTLPQDLAMHQYVQKTWRSMKEQAAQRITSSILSIILEGCHCSDPKVNNIFAQTFPMVSTVYIENETQITSEDRSAIIPDFCQLVRF